MTKKIRIAIVAAAALLFIISTAVVLSGVIDYSSAAHSHDRARETAGVIDTAVTIVPDAPPLAENPDRAEIAVSPEASVPAQAPLAEDALFLADIDLAALQQTNEDVFGWIYIAGTDVSYPLLHGDDNNEYLRTTWEGKRNSSGSIFLEQSNSPEMTDFNTIIYGHNMKNDSMFGTLSLYKKQNYYDSHKLIYIVTADGIRRYEVFAAYEASVKAETYRIGFYSDADKENFISVCSGASYTETEIVPDKGDNILTLSTCTGSGYRTRWVVQAVQTGYFET